jgi:uncharacterized membrane protein
MNPAAFLRPLITAMVLLGFATSPSLQAQVFTDLRSIPFVHLAGVASTSQGPEVVGTIGNDVLQTVRWTRSTGPVVIAGLQTEPYPFIPEGLSADGKVIVGRGAGTGDNLFRPSAYRWTEQTGLQELTSNIRDSGFSERTRVSADGTTVSGFGATAGFRWTEQTGTVLIGAKLNGIDDVSAANPLFFPKALSSDGSVLVGTNTADPFQRGEASRWTEATGLVGLGPVFNNGAEETGVATGVSGNGAVIVGTGYIGEDFSEAFRWTETGGMMALGLLPGGGSSFAVGISTDGGRIFGGTVDAAHPFSSSPFVWTAANGMRSLVDELTSLGAGADVAGWQLGTIAAFSNDGRFVVGRGIGPDGTQGLWLADLGMSPVPEPSAVGVAAAAGLLGFIAFRRRKFHSSGTTEIRKMPANDAIVSG